MITLKASKYDMINVHTRMYKTDSKTDTANTVHELQTQPIRIHLGSGTHQLADLGFQ